MSMEYAARHAELLSDDTVVRYLRIRKPVTLEDQSKWLERALASNTNALHAILALDESDAQAYIGIAQLREIDPVDKTAHGGLLVADKRYWSRGVGSEARGLQLRYAFESLGLRWVFGRTVACNAAARRLLEKTGYEVQGVRPRSRFVEGEYWDEILFGISREKWEASLRR
jgi:diamine N-acetyltransferase